MSFTNLYYKRTAGTPRACFICNKPTTTVLATIQAVDFIYSCPSHLSDPGFATPFAEEPAKQAPTQEDIGKAIADWEDRQKHKQEKEKAEKEKADKEKAEKEKAKAEKFQKEQDKEKEEASKSKEDLKPGLPGSLTPKSPSQPTHERYVLHRDIFSMRRDEHRKRRNAAQAKALAPRLPGAPRWTL